MENSQAHVSSVIRMLVTTDNHLGHKEGHLHRGNDSFEAFEEALQIAKEENVDFVLLGGDLFHEVNPSKETMHKAINLFRNNIFGDREVFIRTRNFTPNFANPNINIDLPVFAIHGNHDYPSSEKNISTLDLLSSCSLVNYFGKVEDFENIKIHPVIIQKNETKIAIYGIGHVKDVRLHHYFEQGRVQFVRPENDEDYFNVLILHQNRFKGMSAGNTYKNCIHYKMLPRFINLCIWGHEHESIDSIEINNETSFYIYQPGSTVITSLIEAEAKPKHVGLIEFTKTEFKFRQIFLKRQRQLIYRQIDLEAEKHAVLAKRYDPKMTMQDCLERQVEKIIESMLEEASFTSKMEGGSGEKPGNSKSLYYNPTKLPLLRLKIDHTGMEELIHTQKIELKYAEKVANAG